MTNIRANRQDYQQYRREYQADGLRRSALAETPWQQFAHWLKDAEYACPQDATSMTLATANQESFPTARIVLLKGFDETGLLWYTDSRSHKGRQLAQNPRAALLFYWAPLERQVRITGNVVVLPENMADAYFQSRPRDSQLSALASSQSQVVADRTVLEQRVADLQSKLAGRMYHVLQPG